MRILATGISGGIGEAFHIRSQSHRDWIMIGLARMPGVHEIAFDVSWPLARLQSTLQALAPVDAVLCLAGADILSPPLRDTPYFDRLDALYQVDVQGTIKTIHAALPHLAQDGVIITMGWDRAGLGQAGEAGELYALAKAAVTSYSKSLAQSLIHRASVYVVAPGWVKTRWGAALPVDKQFRMAQKTRAKTWQTPDEVARVLESLLVFPRTLATGQVIYVNRGDVMPS